MIEVPDPLPLIDEVKVTRLTPQLSAQAIASMTMSDYEKVRHLLLEPVMVEWQNHYKRTGSLT